MKINEIVVVEGKHDTEKLQKYFEVDTIETNGLGLDTAKIQMIAKAHQKRGVIVFTDPDGPGDKIRCTLNNTIDGLKNAFIDKRLCRTSKKVGIEHADKQALEMALSHVCTFNKSITNTIDYDEYLTLGFTGQPNSKQLREKVGNMLFLGACNAKTLFKRLNMYQITYEELKQIVEDINE